MHTHPALQLQERLLAGSLVQVPGAYDALSARLVERAGFPAVYMTGFGATAARLGQPDIVLLTQTEMTTHARDMVRAVAIPVIADADTGYGGPSNIERTVREYIQAGVAAIHLEDQVAPKRCGQMAGIRLMDARENERRLRCALAADDSYAFLHEAHVAGAWLQPREFVCEQAFELRSETLTARQPAPRGAWRASGQLGLGFASPPSS